MRCSWFALVLLVPLVALPARAATATTDAPARGRGLFLEDEDRWPHKNLVERVLRDLVSIPTDVPYWSREDWALFSTVTTATVGFMAGPNNLDAQVQAWSHQTFGVRNQRFTFWAQPWGEIYMWAPLWTAYALMGLHGLVKQVPEELELFSLVLEALALAQVFELVPKMLLGREGPMNGDARGFIRGPFRAFDIWPAGTPSGHAATLYAVLGTAAAYFDNPWLSAAFQAVGVFFCATLLVDDYHFVSDLIWGAAEGWASGEWVVRHRSTRYANTRASPVRVLPVVEPRSGTAAVTFAVAF